MKKLIMSMTVLMMVIGTGAFAKDFSNKQRAREAEIRILQNQAVSEGVKLITPEEAKEAAFAAAGINGAQVKRVKVKLDREDDYRPALYIYEVEFKHDGLEYEFDIDAVNKRILDSDVDSWYD